MENSLISKKTYLLRSPVPIVLHLPAPTIFRTIKGKSFAFLDRWHGIGFAAALQDGRKTRRSEGGHREEKVAEDRRRYAYPEIGKFPSTSSDLGSVFTQND